MKASITRRKFIQSLTATGVGLASAQLLAACAAPAPTAAPDAAAAVSAPAASDVKLRMQVPPDGQGKMPAKMAQRYQDETGVMVTIEETIYSEIETKSQTGFISNTLQDVLYGHHRWLFINYVKGIYLQLDDLMAADPLPGAADMYASLMKNNSWDGKNFSVPGVVHPGGNIMVAFNKTMLEKKGLPLPKQGWTMADWEALARGAAEPGSGVFGMNMSSMNALHYYSNTARSFADPASKDGDVFNADGTKIVFNTALHAEVGNWYSKLLEDKIAPRKADYVEAANAESGFVAGINATQATIVGGIATFLSQIEGKFEMDAVPLPVGAKGRQGTCYSGNMHMVGSKTAHPEEAYGLLKLLSSAEAGVSMVLDGKLQPNGHYGAWTDTKVVAVSKMYGVAAELLKAGVEPFPMPRNTRFSEANKIFQNEIDLVWEGDAKWADQAPIIEAKVQEVLDMAAP